VYSANRPYVGFQSTSDQTALEEQVLLTMTQIQSDTILDFYTQTAPFTALDRHESSCAALPVDVPSLTRIVQGLMIHEFFTSAYGVTIPDARRVESHLRPVAQLLDRILELDGRPLDVPRAADFRLLGVCRHFSLLLVALLRHKGIPARARCGFGTYFNPGYYEDHWVCEYWHHDQQRWVLVDAQFDQAWRSTLKITHDVMDVPRDRFLIAADAWRLCRAGVADPEKFGIFRGNLRGPWFVAGNLVRDLAALVNHEMLPWDVWGAMPGPADQMSDDALAFFDHLAELTHDPDVRHSELIALYESDSRVRIQAVVFNAVLQRPEHV
jgi:hypothetical protein